MCQRRNPELVRDNLDDSGSSNIDHVIDVSGHTHLDYAGRAPSKQGKLLSFHAFRGQFGGRPTSTTHTPQELGDWSNGDLTGVEGSDVTLADTTKCDIRELRGGVTEPRHLSMNLADARPVIIRGGAVIGRRDTSEFPFPTMVS